MLHLFLGRVADAYDGFLDRIGGVFAHLQTILGGDQERDPPRLAQFQRTGPVGIDKHLLNGGGIGLMFCQHFGQGAMQRQEAFSHLIAPAVTLTICDMADSTTRHRNDPPPKCAEPRINADDL